MSKPVTNVAASVRQRLLNFARESKQDFGLLLTKYALGNLPEEEATTWEQSILAPNSEVANHLCNLIVVKFSLTLPAPRLLFGIR